MAHKNGVRAAQTAREHKDLSTQEIAFRLKLAHEGIVANETAETELVRQLTELRKTIKNLQEDAAGFTRLLDLRGTI